jgi:putative DNA primase/helicase
MDGDETFVKALRRLWPSKAPLRCTDSGNAEHFAEMFGEIVRFDHLCRDWLIFEKGRHWRVDRIGHVKQLATESVRTRQKQAVTIEDLEVRKRATKWALDSENRARLDSLIDLAKSQPGIAVEGGWDKPSMLLGVPNGVIDLRNGTLREGRVDDYITKAAPVPFDPTATCPRWERFIVEIMGGDEEMARYLRRVFGYLLTAETGEQVFWIFWGDGSNGKSTLIEVFMRVLGDSYCWTIPFPSDSWSDSLNEYHKAMLENQRIVTASEVSRRGKLNDELIKSLTGGDKINARHPYCKPFTYVPVAKFILRVNEKPEILDQSHGMWRRVKLVPFTQTFALDQTLTPTLLAEAPGILAWAVRGCLEWQTDGLAHPAAVEAATNEYRAESDPFLQFVNECCVVHANASVNATELFKSYVAWCEAQQTPQINRMSQRAFGMRARAMFGVKDGRTVTYTGVGLQSEEY